MILTQCRHLQRDSSTQNLLLRCPSRRKGLTKDQPHDRIPGDVFTRALNSIQDRWEEPLFCWSRLFANGNHLRLGNDLRLTATCKAEVQIHGFGLPCRKLVLRHSKISTALCSKQVAIRSIGLKQKLAAVLLLSMTDLETSLSVCKDHLEGVDVRLQGHGGHQGALDGRIVVAGFDEAMVDGCNQIRLRLHGSCHHSFGFRCSCAGRTLQQIPGLVFLHNAHVSHREHGTDHGRGDDP
mmetsp:Transcript_77147/g.170336  ORF Transcript_77147/g.170336 Transcript_77147/m.170336 type:complete len:238 (-) Transcript_77147:271-984(-)